MAVRAAVVFKPLPVEIVRDFCGFFRGNRIKVHCSRKRRFAFEHFGGMRVRGGLEALLNGVCGGIHITHAAHKAGVEHADGCHRSKTFIRLSSIERIAAPAADAERAKTRGINAGIGEEVRGHAVDILCTELRFVGVTRFASAGTLISSIGCNCDVAEFSEALREETGHLFLCAAVGMRNNDCRVGLFGVVVGRRINVGSDLDAVQAVGHRMDIDFTRRVCFNGSLVHQTIRIELGNIVGGGGNAGDAGGSAHSCSNFLQSRHDEMSQK